MKLLPILAIATSFKHVVGFGARDLLPMDQAKLTQCSAARFDSLTDEEVSDTLLDVLPRSDDIKHLDWGGNNPLVHRRRIAYASHLWANNKEGYNHCAYRCILPAISFGFDAAMCRLVTTTGINRLLVIYTPSEALRCHGRRTTLQKGSCGDRWKETLPEDAKDDWLQSRDEIPAVWEDGWDMHQDPESDGELKWFGVDDWNNTLVKPFWNSRFQMTYNGQRSSFGDGRPDPSWTN